MPLQMGVVPPQTTGWTGALFHLLHGFDQPYNLFPSLHIALRTILAELYARHTKGATRIASHVWFSLIGFSTLLTYQHHFVDVVGGFVLAVFCFYIFREQSHRRVFIPNRRVGSYYAMSSLLCLCAAFAAWPRTAILLWPALSLGVVASGYWFLGPAIFGKSEGKLPWSTRIILAPVIFGQYLSLFHYRCQADAWNEVTPRLWLGARLHQRDAAQARHAGVTAVLDLTTEFSEHPTFRELAYCNIPVLDLTELTAGHLRQAVEFISQHAKSGIVYVHCKVGYSRSAAAVGAYLIASGAAADASGALEILRWARPGIIFRPEVFMALEKFCRADESKFSSVQATSVVVPG
jgi:protein-tyrosine phosphatase